LDLSDDDRDKSARNRMLLCTEHHNLVDKRPRAYPVLVLRKMKEDHEGKYLPPVEHSLAPVPVTETLRASLLPVVGIPSVVMGLPLANGELSEPEVARAMHWPADRSVTVPFIVRERRLYSFANLTVSPHPFEGLVNQERAEILPAKNMWENPEGHRRYVALLNKALTKHLGAQRVRFDPEHRRYWFMADLESESRVVRYRTKQGRSMDKEVVRRRIRRATSEAKEWVHVAAGLRFEHVAKDAWVLAIRPEFQFTSDGKTPLPPKQQGSKSTRKKSHIYNEQYLDSVHFWVDFLADGQEYLTIKAADQRIRVQTSLEPREVTWPGVPDDLRRYSPKPTTDGGLLALMTELEAADELHIEDRWHANGEEELA
jgi:hypothetical protein